MLSKKNMTKQEYATLKLAKEIRRSSKGQITKDKRYILAKYVISRIDFSNPYQTHKSLRGYADIIVDKYMRGHYSSLFEKDPHI